MRLALEGLKREGVAFEFAWEVAWGTIIWPHDTTHRRQWKEALEDKRAEWEAAYAGVETPASLTMNRIQAAITALEAGISSEMTGYIAA